MLVPNGFTRLFFWHHIPIFHFFWWRKCHFKDFFILSYLFSGSFIMNEIRFIQSCKFSLENPSWFLINFFIYECILFIGVNGLSAFVKYSWYADLQNYSLSSNSFTSIWCECSSSWISFEPFIRLAILHRFFYFSPTMCKLGIILK